MRIPHLKFRYCILSYFQIQYSHHQQEGCDMDDWISGACDQVDTLVEKEPYFRVLPKQAKP